MEGVALVFCATVGSQHVWPCVFPGCFMLSARHRALGEFTVAGGGEGGVTVAGGRVGGQCPIYPPPPQPEWPCAAGQWGKWCTCLTRARGRTKEKGVGGRGALHSLW